MDIFIHKRKKIYFNNLLTDQKIKFVDVGSGGQLKYPWALIPEKNLEKLNIEPIGSSPLCISNVNGKGVLNIAYDERSSSLHTPLETYINKFGRTQDSTKEKIDVELLTMDNYLNNERIDAIDINVEGHDFQVLQGMQNIIKNSLIKLIKIEFELTKVWDGQGWFSEIDGFMRDNDYELVDIELEYLRQANVKNIFHKGIPVWGKAYYSPSINKFKERNDFFNSYDEILKTIVLYVSADILGHSFELIDLYNNHNNNVQKLFQKNDISKIYKFGKLENAADIIRQMVGKSIRTFIK